jgi:hypothetical protein
MCPSYGALRSFGICTPGLRRGLVYAAPLALVWAVDGRKPSRRELIRSDKQAGLVEFATILRMVLHTFAFRWKSGVSEEQKLRARAEILALQGQIPGLLETYVGVNISPRGQGLYVWRGDEVCGSGGAGGVWAQCGAQEIVGMAGAVDAGD